MSAEVLDTNGARLAYAAAFDSAAATGGTLDDGKPGVRDIHTFTTAGVTRYYDDVLVTAPELDAAIYASQSAELRTEGMFREDLTGAAYGPISVPIGDLPRIPVSGEAERPVELFLKGSRGDFDTLPDSGIDDIRAQVFYRPSYITVL